MSACGARAYQWRFFGTVRAERQGRGQATYDLFPDEPFSFFFAGLLTPHAPRPTLFCFAADCAFSFGRESATCVESLPPLFPPELSEAVTVGRRFVPLARLALRFCCKSARVVFLSEPPLVAGAVFCCGASVAAGVAAVFWTAPVKRTTPLEITVTSSAGSRCRGVCSMGTHAWEWVVGSREISSPRNLLARWGVQYKNVVRAKRRRSLFIMKRNKRLRFSFCSLVFVNENKYPSRKT